MNVRFESRFRMRLPGADIAAGSLMREDFLEP